jgi:hypothetical protein
LFLCFFFLTSFFPCLSSLPPYLYMQQTCDRENINY